MSDDGRLELARDARAFAYAGLLERFDRVVAGATTVEKMLEARDRLLPELEEELARLDASADR